MDIWIVRGIKMRIDVLASGSKGNCCIIRDGTTCIMIDCGTTKKYLFSSFEKVHVSKEEIDALLITHDHSDHVSQIRKFSDLTIYSPVDIPDIETLSVQPLKPFTVETLRITPIALSHDALHTTGYIFDNGMEKCVYITDTGYVSEKYIPLLKGAEYIILESNHDVDMLMHTRRPQFIKSRIISDSGHLCNEDCADILDKIVTNKTKSIFLAHISQEGNTRQQALQISYDMLKKHTDLSHELIISALGQFEITTKGENDEESSYGSVCCAIGMECFSDSAHT